MAKMKEIYTALQEAESVLKTSQLFPPEAVEVEQLHRAINALLGSVHTRNGITTREDQESMF
jgi:hypothetical protein